jgi:psiF repeat
MIKKLALVLSLSFATATMAADMTCNASVTEKKLAGAAKTSYMKKCEAEAKAACEALSKEKKLAGAAKTSFEKKCIIDTVGEPPAK